MKFSKILAAAAVFCTVLATSCVKETPVPTGMSLDQTAVTVFVGQTATVTPTFTPSDAKATSLVWTSSDEKVATVDGGYVKGIAAGTATITGKAQGSITATCSVTVKNIDPTKFEITPTEMTLIKNSDSQQITYVLEPSNVTLSTVTFSSSDETVATVDAKGNVAPVDKGSCTITVKLEAGLTKTCAVKVINGPETLDMWKSYDAGSRELYGLAADEGKSAGDDGWLYWSNGNVNWKANTTGATRTATLELTSGSKITVKQIDAVDFKGDYAFTSRGFFANNSVWASKYGHQAKTTDPSTQNITIGAPLLGETLTDQDGKSYTNQVGVRGFYDDAVIDATVAIDFDAKTAKLGLLLDARKAQATTYSNKAGYDYVCFLPEMATGTGSSWSLPWNFVQADLDADATKDFVYLWFNANEDMTAFQWNSFTEAQFMTRSAATSANRIIGITCAVSKAAEATAANVFATYNVIFQANTNNSNKTYMSFTRK